jgi:glutamyl-Q tRNA(Asp) synthetase
MDDLDPPREQPGAASTILHSLEQHGLHWDEQLMWQSERSDAYEEALGQLADNNKTFYCYCSRQQLSPGGSCRADCRNRPDEAGTARAIRIGIDRETLVGFDDQLQGHQIPDHGLDDFVVKRKDGLYAYQLAVVVDDASQNISHIVRGSDLMDSTVRQIYLQHTLGLPTPQYCHLPVITNTAGQKFSKQNHAPALVDSDAPQNLRRALAFLRQEQTPQDCNDTASILSFAISHWAIDRVPGVPAIAATSTDLT